MKSYHENVSRSVVFILEGLGVFLNIILNEIVSSFDVTSDIWILFSIVASIL